MFYAQDLIFLFLIVYSHFFLCVCGVSVHTILTSLQGEAGPSAFSATLLMTMTFLSHFSGCRGLSLLMLILSNYIYQTTKGQSRQRRSTLITLELREDWHM